MTKEMFRRSFILSFLLITFSVVSFGLKGANLTLNQSDNILHFHQAKFSFLPKVLLNQIVVEANNLVEDDTNQDTDNQSYYVESVCLAFQTNAWNLLNKRTLNSPSYNSSQNVNHLYILFHEWKLLCH
jgi:hypothetical protein